MKMSQLLLTTVASLAANMFAAQSSWGRPALVLSAGRSAPPTTSAGTASPPAPPSAALPGNGVTPKVEPSREALALSDAFANAAAAIRPSVVRLEIEGTADLSTVTFWGQRPGPDVPDVLHRFFDLDASGTPRLPVPVQGTGAGIIIDAQGDVLTGYHVIRGAKKVTIKLADHRSFSGRVIGTDPLTDLGVVRFDQPPPGLLV